MFFIMCSKVHKWATIFLRETTEKLECSSCSLTSNGEKSKGEVKSEAAVRTGAVKETGESGACRAHCSSGDIGQCRAVMSLMQQRHKVILHKA